MVATRSSSAAPSARSSSVMSPEPDSNVAAPHTPIVGGSTSTPSARLTRSQARATGNTQLLMTPDPDHAAASPRPSRSRTRAGHDDSHRSSHSRSVSRDSSVVVVEEVESTPGDSSRRSRSTTPRASSSRKRSSRRNGGHDVEDRKVLQNYELVVEVPTLSSLVSQRDENRSSTLEASSPEQQGDATGRPVSIASSSEQGDGGRKQTSNAASSEQGEVDSESLDTPQAAFSGSAAGTSAAADDDDASDDSDDESSSESDSESDSDLDDDSGSDTETEAITPPSSSASSRPGLDPKDLLARALAAARSKAASQQTTADDDEQEVDELQMDVMQIGGSGEDGGTTTKKERPIPGLSVTLPAHYRKLDLRQQDEKKERKGKQPVVISPEQDSSSSREHEVDDAVYKKPLSRKDKLKIPRSQSISEQWASLPAPPASLLPQMKRDYQALALANSLDPKRFMKGSGSSSTKTKIPETFAIGTLHTPSRRLQDTTLPRERQYRPGSIVETLVKDTGVNGYAKRKFDEFASKRMDNGRGRGWKKRK